jgi:hypothetical protein
MDTVFMVVHAVTGERTGKLYDRRYNAEVAAGVTIPRRYQNDTWAKRKHRKPDAVVECNLVPVEGQ